MGDNPLFDPNKAFPEMGDDGLIRYYSIDTGEVLAVLGGDAHTSRATIEYSTLERADGSKFIVQKNISIDAMSLNKRGVPYTPLLGSLICAQIAVGRDLVEISKDHGMPSYTTLLLWRREIVDFAEKLEMAYADRADYFTNRALKEAEEAMPTPGGAAKAKLVVDVLWRLAEVGNGRKYSPKMKISGDPNAPLQIIINTGIRRPGDPGYIMDETAKIRDAQKIPVSESVAKIEDGKESNQTACLDNNEKKEDG